MTRRQRIAAAAALIVAAVALRGIPWLANYPLHRDEALYGYWARLIASGRDPLLLTTWIDKPPLVIYLLAASLRTFGTNELALRLPGMAAGLLTLAATYALAKRAYGSPVAWLAAALLTLSPFAILFAPTAFTDPWLTLWLVLTAWAALSGRAFGAGATLGLAVASKQQGLLGAPLMLALLAAQAGGHPRPWRHFGQSIGAGLLGFAVIFVPVIYWDSLRWSNRPSFWDRSLLTYGGLGVAAPAEWPRRAAEWGAQLALLFGLPALSALMLGGAAAVGVRGVVRWAAERRAAAGAELAHRVDAVLAGFVLGYLALHAMITFQVWDRYLLPLAPLVCVLAARGVAGVICAARRRVAPDLNLLSPAFQRRMRLPLPNPAWTRRAGLVGATVLALVLIYAAVLGTTGRLPVGSDHGAYAGLDRVVTTVRQQPGDAVVYHQCLGWYFDFYLFDAPQERRWWDSGWKLASDAFRTAQQTPARRQIVILAAWETPQVDVIRLALTSKGLALVETDRIRRPDGTPSFTLYRIMPAQEAFAR